MMEADWSGFCAQGGRVAARDPAAPPHLPRGGPSEWCRCISALKPRLICLPPRVVKITDGQWVVARGWGEEGNGALLLMVTDFQFYKKKRVLVMVAPFLMYLIALNDTKSG